MPKPAVKTGPRDGKFQPEPSAKQKKRYLLDKKVQRSDGVRFQTYRDEDGKVQKRYLLHKG